MFSEGNFLFFLTKNQQSIKRIYYIYHVGVLPKNIPVCFRNTSDKVRVPSVKSL